MSIKRIFVAISAIFAASAVFADNSSVTSKKYVDDLMSGYQGKLPGSGANTLMIYDDETGVGEKSIAATLGNSASATSVPTVGAVKTGLDGLQDTITGTEGYVMTGTGNPGEVGERAIYSANTNYSDSLVTAETVNTGVINAVNSSLRRVNENGDLDSNGTLWEINTDLLALSVFGYLPDGYTALEYIQSSGSQYIDTGRVPNNDDIIEQKFQKVGASTTTCSWYGSMPSSQTLLPRIGIGSYSAYAGAATIFAGSNYTGPVGTADTNVHTLRFQATGENKLTYTLDGVTNVIAAPSGNMYEPAIELTSYLFARHGTNGVQAYDNEGTKIYYHREYLANGTLVLNMVPVKKTVNGTDVYGMYDLVSGQFFTNQGTGNFTAGPPVAQ